MWARWQALKEPCASGSQQLSSVCFQVFSDTCCCFGVQDGQELYKGVIRHKKPSQCATNALAQLHALEFAPGGRPFPYPALNCEGSTPGPW